jgi:hypothetical protein
LTIDERVHTNSEAHVAASLAWAALVPPTHLRNPCAATTTNRAQQLTMSTQVKYTATRTYLSSEGHSSPFGGSSPSLSDPGAIQSPDANRVIPEHAQSCPRPTPMSLENMDVEFPDGSQWQIESPQSDMSFQLEHSPCEARQVFTARCIFDPAKDYDQHVKAVIKVAFQ